MRSSTRIRRNRWRTLTAGGVRVFLSVFLLSFFTTGSFAQPFFTPTLDNINLPFTIDGSVVRQMSGSGDWTKGAFSNGTMNGAAFTNAGVPQFPLTYHIIEQYNSNTDTVFSGGDKVDDDPRDWGWVTSSVTPKDDINNVGISIAKAPDGHTWAAFSGDRYSTNGDSYIDFEFFQKAVTMTPTGGFAVDPSTYNTGGRTPGDLLVSLEYVNGGGVPHVYYYKWANTGSELAPVYDYIPYTPLPAQTAYSATNAISVAVPYSAFGNANYGALQFVEGAVDLSALINASNAPCTGLNFQTIMVKSKSSTSPTAQVKDLVAPIQVNINVNLATFHYGGPYCSGGTGTAAPQFEAGSPGGGTFTSSPAGLSINAVSGVVDLSASTAGEYTVTYSYNALGNGCPKTATATIVIEGRPAAPTLGKVDPTCALGTGCVTITSATAGLTFSIDGSAYVSYPENGWCGLAPGVHTVTAKNGAGCVSPQATITIANQPSTPTAPTLGKVDPTCAVGTGCVTISSATAGLTFSIDGSAYVSYPENGWCGLAPGVHTVTAKNGAGCVSPQATITIANQPSTPTAPTLGKVDPTCAVGTGCVTITSATAGLTFSIDGSAYVSYPENGWCGLAPGVHTVTAKNGAGCVSPQATITIANQPSTPTAPTLGKVDPTCAVGTGCVTITSATAGLTFSIDGSAYVSYPENGWCGLAPGVHTVTAKNEAGCVSSPASITIANQPSTPTAPTLGKVDPTCALGTGCVTISSATAGLTFSIDGSAYVSYPVDGWCGLAPGAHSVTAKNEAGCVSSPASITIANQPSTPTAPTLGKVDPTCAVGTGCVTITSATAGLTFSIDGSAYVSYPVGGWCGLAPGAHSITAKNEAGCVSSPASITIANQPSTPTAPTLGKVDPTCALGTGCVTISSATAGLTFSIDGSAYVSYPVGGWCGLAPGAHSVTAKNGAGCVSPQATITIANQPSTPTAPTLGKVDPTCAVGTGCVTITSATAGLTFSIDGSATYVSYPENGWCGLAPGVHTVTAKNGAGCVSPQATITIANQPSTPTAPTLGKVDPTCAVGTGCVTISSATAGLTFSIDGSAYVSYPENGWCGLAPGVHTVTAKNGAGCVSPQATITIANQPSTPTAPTLGKVDPTCAVGTGCVTITSATAGLTFSIDGSAYVSYPENGWCGLAPGVHTVTAKNGAGCVSPQATITIANQPSTPTAPTLGKVDPTCAVGTGCVTITSATAGLTFSIDGSAYVSYPVGGWCGLVPGAHTVTAKNGAGCVSPQATITIANQPSTPTAPTLGKVDPTCAVGTGCVTITSATAGLTFSIDGSATYVSYPENGWCGLAPGVHTVTAKNGAGCVSPQATITIANQPSTPTAPTLGKVDPTCAVGTGCVTITSATAGLTFSIDGSAYVSYPENGWCGLAPGVHTVTAKNGAGCVSPQATITIANQPSTPTAPTLGKVDPTCAVGTGCVTITSATAGLTFSIDGSAYVSYPENGWCGLAPGVHTVTAKNGAGCVSPQATITIANQPSTPTAPTLGKVDPTCAVGTGCVTITSATAGLTFSIDGSAYVSYPENGWCGLAPGAHTVTAKNGAGCVSPQATITIANQPSTPTAPTLGKVDPTCAVGTGCVTITSATAGLTFSIDGSATYVSYPENGWCGLAPGAHSVTAKNEAGCVSSPASITIANQPSCASYCSYTQGFWGNRNGLKMMQSANLLAADLVIGRSGRSVTIPAGSAAILNKMMPGGSTPISLASGNYTIGTSAFTSRYLTKQGRINNNLLSQTITLALNTRLNGGALLSFGIEQGCLVTGLDTFAMNVNVVNYLTNNGMETATVADLLDLANDVLGGVRVPGTEGENGNSVPSYSDVTNAVDIINNAFDGCTSFNGYQSCDTDPVLTKAGKVAAGSLVLNQQIKVAAYPNPFNDKIRFTIKSSVNGQGSLQVFNLLGQKINTVFQGFLSAGIERVVEYNVPAAARQNLIYVLSVNGERVTGKLLNNK